ncbi:hypothetical protein FISHEDRAFT_75505 [Fistulina hepatica ATCC 64428]|uniref:Cep57 centrosome microtubule-binding domain-containing protein n=1 Tax=Fistulina hepatica ATCC 64428 TaxID=1128425 RepID=A0A0D7A9G6_9AGAR|nr:hypothetical protein FISHEDRAFT_75505 [Fistulina hepatica ATCC 64428]
MSSGTRSLDISIHDDEQEARRQQLEHNLQQTAADLSLHLTDDDEHASSVEYPRHNSNSQLEYFFHDKSQFDDDGGDLEHPNSIDPYASRSRSQDPRSLSYASYGGRTISTAAHHASAVTLSAGLAGRRGNGRRDVSLSGAEYDPDRPLHDIIGAIDYGDVSSVRAGQSRTEFQRTDAPRQQDLRTRPLVADGTAELDRLLESGHAMPPGGPMANRRLPTHNSIAQRSVRLRSPSPSSSSEDSIISNTTARPRLSDALNQMSFSPKRPRSPQVSRSQFPTNETPRPPRRASVQPPTPSPLGKTQTYVHSPLGRTPPARNAPSANNKSSLKTSSSLSNAPPAMRVGLDNNKASVSSPFTQAARGIGRELERERLTCEERTRAAHAPEARVMFAADVSKGGYGKSMRADVSRGLHPADARSPYQAGKTLYTPDGRSVHLPDVTGLTSAVMSPAKDALRRARYEDTRPRDSEARILAAIGSIHAQLERLEDENGVSRRRVRELEMELDRVREREAELVREKRREKGKQRAADDIQEEGRFKEVAEEKKALETLITTLRTHLTRLTLELSQHKDLLIQLQQTQTNLQQQQQNMASTSSTPLPSRPALQPVDATSRSAAWEAQMEARWESRWLEVKRLREDVERLSGEVEVLRGVVDEGLRDCEHSRVGGPGGGLSTRNRSGVDPDTAMSLDDDEGEDDEHDDGTEQHGNETVNLDRAGTNHDHTRDQREIARHQEHDDEDEEVEEGNEEPDEPTVRLPSNDSIKSDRATVGAETMPRGGYRQGNRSLGQSMSQHGQSFVQSFVSGEELDALGAELEARRSLNSTHDTPSLTHSLSESPTPQGPVVVVQDATDEHLRCGRLAVPTIEKQDNIFAPRPLSAMSNRPPSALSDRPPSVLSNRPPSVLSNRSNRPPSAMSDRPPSAMSRHAPRQAMSAPVSDPEPQPSTLRLPHQDTPFRPSSSAARSSGNRTTSGRRSAPLDETPFPQIRGTHLERLFFAVPEHNPMTCTVCHRRRRRPHRRYTEGVQTEEHVHAYRGHENESFAEVREDNRDTKGKRHEVPVFDATTNPAIWDWNAEGARKGLPPQTVLARVIRELEDDFTHYKSVYCELADQYKEMDAVSDVRRRNILAQHLREVVDILEQKGDQVASLYDLLTFRDKAVTESVVPPRRRVATGTLPVEIPA